MWACYPGHEQAPGGDETLVHLSFRRREQMKTYGFFMWDIIPPCDWIKSYLQNWEQLYEPPGPDFTIRSFKYCAPQLYNTLPKTIRQLNNIETFKKELKTYIFSETFDLETKTIRDCFST